MIPLMLFAFISLTPFSVLRNIFILLFRTISEDASSCEIIWSYFSPCWSAGLLMRQLFDIEKVEMKDVIEALIDAVTVQRKHTPNLR